MTKNDKCLPATGIIVHCLSYLKEETRIHSAATTMGEIYVHWNGSLHSLVCISLQPHCVSAVNRKTISFQCNSGRLLIALRRVFVVLLLCFSFHSVVFVSAYCLFCCLYLLNSICESADNVYAFAACPIHFDVDTHAMLYPFGFCLGLLFGCHQVHRIRMYIYIYGADLKRVLC